MPVLLYDVKDHVATITLNRPEKFNSFNREMALALQLKLDESDADSSIRCVIITGTGKGFCAGQDISEISGNTASLEKLLVEQYNPVVTRIRNLQKPVLAAVNGIAAGAGANLALCCDIIIAKSSASFIQAFTKIGLIPDSGGTFFLPRLIGLQRASALMMLGDKISANEAQHMGMIYKVFSDESFDEETINLAQQLAAMPTKALAYIKEALNQTFTNNVGQQLALEDQLQQKAGVTNDFKEGVQAFLQKRAPVFKGE